MSTSLSLWIIFLASVFCASVNLLRACRIKNIYGKVFHVIVTLTSVYFAVIFFLAIVGIFDDHFGPIYARPATILILALLGAAAIAYPGDGDVK